MIGLLRRTWREYEDKGISYVINAGMHVIFNWLFFVLYIKKFKKRRRFKFQGRSYSYFFHWHNTTWKNERAVEIPIILKIIKEFQGKNILEVGNVLSYYFPIDHDVLDKYDLADGIIREDVVDFRPNKKYDLIVSISTLEHVGWDENPKDPRKALGALKNLKALLAPRGKIVITFPLGHNPTLDESLTSGKREFNNLYFFKQVSEDNEWKELDSPFPKERSLAIGIIIKGR